MRVIVTGGAGFVGSHLCDALIARGDSVVCLDNLSTGHPENVAHLAGHPGFELAECDVSTGIDVDGPVHVVAHLASAASPPDYQRLPLETLAVGSRGTENALNIAESKGARFLLASTSEVYGDPAVHPQTEDYWGNVNPIGPRSVYDEAKRFAEAMTFAYGRTRGVNVGVIRIFNTYGPRMSAHDGRVVTNFITQALNGGPITIYGNGKQTRSFCYVDDLVRGVVAMIDSAERGPINLGNPDEFTIADFAALVLRITGSSAPVEHRPLPVDDPLRRRPDISRAQSTLGWRPEVPPAEGVRRTAEWLLSGPLLCPDVRMLEGLRLPGEIGRPRVHAEPGQIQPGAEKGGTQAEDESIPG
jgi:dTDP-glucose 4,6-dehydratase